MAKFLNTSATNYYLEELIKNTAERLVLISPYLKINDRIKELLEDKNRLKIDVRIVFGKSELQPREIKWLDGLSFIRTAFCKNLHAKCYLNETECIITSLNLYQFSQVNNNEMGVYINRLDDCELYSNTYDEAQRIIRISEEIRISTTTPQSASASHDIPAPEPDADEDPHLSSSKMARKLKMSTAEFFEKASAAGLVDGVDKTAKLTQEGE